MAQPNLALRTTRNGLFSHCVVAGSKNPLPLGMGSVKKIWALYNSLQDAINYVKNKDKTTEVVTTDGESASKNYLAPNLKDKSEVELLDLSAAVGYVSQTYKTENRRLVSGVNCSNDKPFRDMQTTRTKYGTFSGLLGYHCVQSFSPGEIDPDEAHLIGLMTAQKIWGEDGYQVVVATHIDRNHIHNHFVVSSVSILGYRNPCCYHRKIAAISDEIVRSCGLSIIENPGQNPAVFPHLTARADAGEAGHRRRAFALRQPGRIRQIYVQARI
ncbi:MAG: relaxase/mobilization nuclease domain-containing protein [Mageeibacillus sp.]|nr:relaxase/mobilization nuclease domain-containing protein [Mageeibacillus sp.]